MSLEVKDLDPISAAVDEEEEVSGQVILAEALLDQPGESVEPLRMSVGRVQRKIRTAN